MLLCTLTENQPPQLAMSSSVLSGSIQSTQHVKPVFTCVRAKQVRWGDIVFTGFILTTWQRESENTSLCEIIAQPQLLLSSRYTVESMAQMGDKKVIFTLCTPRMLASSYPIGSGVKLNKCWEISKKLPLKVNKKRSKRLRLRSKLPSGISLHVIDTFIQLSSQYIASMPKSWLQLLTWRQVGHL